MEIRKFLDEQGLSYLWKKLSLQDYPNNDTLVAVINAIDENKADKTTTEALQQAIDILNGTGDGSVKYTVADAVATIVAQAPEDFDTLKEIADWIANDETGTLNLIERVNTAEKAIDSIVVPTKTSDLTNDSGYISSYTETDPTVPAWAKATTKPTYTASEIGLGNVDNVKQYSVSNPPPYPVTSINGLTGAIEVSTVPSCTTEDDGKFLRVVGGVAAWTTIENAEEANF